MKQFNVALLATMLVALPAGAKGIDIKDRLCNGVAVASTPSPTPTAVVTNPDPALLKQQFSPGYTLDSIATGQNFGGINFPRLGNKTEKVFKNVTDTFAFLDVIFECPSGRLPTSGTIPNPHLFMVVQDSTGDYFQTSTNLAPQHIRSNNNFDAYDLLAQQTDFSFTGGPGGPPIGIPIQCAVVFSGDGRLWNGDSSDLPGLPSRIYVTPPVLAAGDNIYVPGGLDAKGADAIFNFQQPSPAPN